MEGTDVCFAPVLSLAEAPQHPHNVHRGTFVELDGVVQPAPAPRFSAHARRGAAPAGPRRPAHRRGARRVGPRRRPRRQAPRGRRDRVEQPHSLRGMATLVSFHAHPDDESIARRAARWPRRPRPGHRIVLVFATKGEHGEVADGFLDDGEELWRAAGAGDASARPRSSACSGSSSSATTTPG